MRDCMSASLRSNRHTIITSRCCCIVDAYGIDCLLIRFVHILILSKWVFYVYVTNSGYI
jgi:hypothetical protein